MRAFKDFALCFGDAACVYAYNRIRLFLTTFFRVCFGMAVWNYFDDSAVVERKVGANLVWYILLKIHAMLRTSMTFLTGTAKRLFNHINSWIFY